MKTFAILAACTLAAALVACQPSHSKDPFAPSDAMAATSGTPIEQLGKGHAIFMRQCTQCHEQRIPNQIPTKEWHNIVPGMAWNAGLSKQEESLVTNYIIAASQMHPKAP